MDEKGLPTVVIENGKVKTIVNNPTNNKAGGWYSLGDGKYARYWAWTTGDEKGQIFYVQTTGENVAGPGGTPDGDKDKNQEWMKQDHGYKEKYANFALGEPNDDCGRDDKSQTALAVNHNVYVKNDTGKIFISKWDDMPNAVDTLSCYVVEQDIGKTSLKINAGETLLKGAVGNISKLNNLTINSSANINAEGSVQVVNNMVAKAAIDDNFKDSIDAKTGQVYLSADNDVNASGNVNAKGAIAMLAGHDVNAGGIVSTKNDVYMQAFNDITTTAVNVDKRVDMRAGNDVIIKGKITGKAEGVENAVDIRAQQRFMNEYGADAISVGTGSHWKVYSATPYADNFGSGVGNSTENDLKSKNFAEWGWDGASTTTGKGDLYIFKYHPTLTIKATDVTKEYGVDWSTKKDTGHIMSNSLSGQFLNAFKDGNDAAFMARDGYKAVGTYSDGYKAEAEVKEGGYPITLTNTENAAPKGYNVIPLNGLLTVYKNSGTDKPGTDNPGSDKPSTDKPSTDKPSTDKPSTDKPSTDKPSTDKPSTDKPSTDKPSTDKPGTDKSGTDKPVEKNLGYLKPQMDALTTSNLKGSASYSQAARQVGPGADRVLGLQSAELPFFREENGKTKLYGTYDVSIDPDKVKMEPTAKILPEPDQPKNQYREYEKELTTEAGTAKFKMTYNGSTFDIYPTDNSAKEMLVAGDAAKNVEVESQALFAAFKEMGITLDDLDGVYTHFDHKKEVQSFRY